MQKNIVLLFTGITQYCCAVAYCSRGKYIMLVVQVHHLLRSQTVLSHQQVNYAVVTSTEVAYFSYIYSVIPVENYQRATGYLRSAMLTGYTLGASLGQMLISLAGRAS